MNADEFRKFGRQAIDWIADYLTAMEGRKVNPSVEPGSIRAQLPVSPPQEGEPMEAILADFERIIVPGLVHWNHPSFFAYFPANNSWPSILGELLSAGVGVNGMNWATSPAATELEERVLDWVRQACGLPEHFVGVIQDTASTSTLVALLCARERATAFESNRRGLAATGKRLIIYASREAHSSVEKAVKIAGLGRENFRPVAVDEQLAMRPEALEEMIEADKAAGHTPCAVVATVGTTSSTALDPLRPIGQIARKHGLWFHVDAALGGSAAIVPEKRYILDGLELADSYVFNAHKWLFTNFDCSLYYVADPKDLVPVFEIMPEYLKSAQDRVVTNFRDWGIPLGRRLRALKLWFVIREYGLDGLRAKVRDHLAWTEELAGLVESAEDFDLLAPVPLQTVCLRYHPGHVDDVERLNEINTELIDAINADGRIYLTQTKLGDKVTIRVSIGQTNTTRDDVLRCWEIITATARGMGG